MEIKLPEKFLNRMKELLGGEYDEYRAALCKPYYRGLRVNTLKADAEIVKKLLDIDLKPAPFCADGYYIPFETESLGTHPLHHAGAFYMQEPSAGSAAAMLGAMPGDKVLDLCAAPGGKSTQIASALQGKGLLWSNEIVKNRANILLSNIERMGVRNAVVSNCHPELLCGRLQGFFDKVLVDAPCSGEGMFRKDSAAVEQWSPEHVTACAARQRSILNSAAKALRPGGVLVYSTCTFSKEENEEVIAAFLKENTNFELQNAEVDFGRPAFDLARRILPMDGGEGHFAARMVKNGGEETAVPQYRYDSPFLGKNKPFEEIVYSLYDELFFEHTFGTSFALLSDKLLLLPEGLPALSGLHVLRAGVLFGEIKKNRVEPGHALFMAAKPQECRNRAELPLHGEEITRYLRGEEIPAPAGVKGFTAVCVEGLTTGFGKCSGGVLKNKYPKGLRNLQGTEKFNGTAV